MRKIKFELDVVEIKQKPSFEKLPAARKPQKPVTAKDYLNARQCRQGLPFVKWDRIGFHCIEVLKFLKGKAWDDVALGYVHSLRPSHIRVIRDSMVQADAQTWRVTVFLDKGVISSIVQEVEVGLPNGCPHGHALGDALKHGLKSKQMKWHRLDGTEVFCSSGIFKMHKQKMVRYPI